MYAFIRFLKITQADILQKYALVEDIYFIDKDNIFVYTDDGFLANGRYRNVHILICNQTQLKKTGEYKALWSF